MAQADLSAPRGTRLGVAFVVAALHVLAIVALVHAFAPSFTAKVADRVTAVFTVEVSPPDPQPKPSPAPAPDGVAAPEGKRATPREAAVPTPKLVIANPAPAPPVAGRGNEAASGASDSGAATGAGGQGSGSGAGGSGQGTGGAGKAVKIAGEINSTRDFPARSRDARRGDHVIVALAIGTDGRVRACRVHRPSRDPEADRITCRLASERFRFRPATDGGGQPVESIYGWQQRWYDAREKE